MRSNKSPNGQCGVDMRVPPSTNTSRSKTGRNASSISRAPGGGLLNISSVTPNADRCAASAMNFRRTSELASNETATISGAVPKTSESRPSVMPCPRLFALRTRNNIEQHRPVEQSFRLRLTCDRLGIEPPRLLGFHDSARGNRQRHGDPRALANVDMLEVEAAIHRFVAEHACGIRAPTENCSIVPERKRESTFTGAHHRDAGERCDSRGGPAGRYEDREQNCEQDQDRGLLHDTSLSGSR